MPTSKFTIKKPSETDSDGVFEGSERVADDFTPIIYPSDLLNPNNYDQTKRIVPFVGFYILLPKDARAVTDDGEAHNDAATEQVIQFRGLDYAQEVNREFNITAGEVIDDPLGTADRIRKEGRIRIYRRVNLLKKFICLYMPETLNSDLNASYDNLSLGQAVAAPAAVLEAVRNGMGGKWKEALSDIVNYAATYSDAGGLVGGIGTFGRYVQAGEGTAVNPLSEMFFSNMQFRQFVLDYRFMAKSKAEAKTVLEIIKTFRQYMVPEIKRDSTAGIFMTVPAFFQIKYYIQEDEIVRENENIPKISGCVLTNVSTDMAPDGLALHKDGMPVAIRMQLQFTELEIMHRDRIKQGY